MKKLTKIGTLVTLFALLGLTTACGSKEKSNDVAMEKAIIEQANDLQAEESFQDDYDLGATSSGLGH
jgi:hypothetical protein